MGVRFWSTETSFSVCSSRVLHKNLRPGLYDNLQRDMLWDREQSIHLGYGVGSQTFHFCTYGRPKLLKLSEKYWCHWVCLDMKIVIQATSEGHWTSESSHFGIWIVEHMWSQLFMQYWWKLVVVVTCDDVKWCCCSTRYFTSRCLMLHWTKWWRCKLNVTPDYSYHGYRQHFQRRFSD